MTTRKRIAPRQITRRRVTTRGAAQIRGVGATQRVAPGTFDLGGNVKYTFRVCGHKDRVRGGRVITDVPYSGLKKF